MKHKDLIAKKNARTKKRSIIAKIIKKIWLKAYTIMKSNRKDVKWRDIGFYAKYNPIGRREEELIKKEYKIGRKKLKHWYNKDVKFWKKTFDIQIKGKYSYIWDHSNTKLVEMQLKGWGTEVLPIRQEVLTKDLHLYVK